MRGSYVRVKVSFAIRPFALATYRPISRTCAFRRCEHDALKSYFCAVWTTRWKGIPSRSHSPLIIHLWVCDFKIEAIALGYLRGGSEFSRFFSPRPQNNLGNNLESFISVLDILDPQKISFALKFIEEFRRRKKKRKILRMPRARAVGSSLWFTENNKDG